MIKGCAFQRQVRLRPLIKINNLLREDDAHGFFLHLRAKSIRVRKIKYFCASIQLEIRQGEQIPESNERNITEVIFFGIEGELNGHIG